MALQAPAISKSHVILVLFVGAPCVCSWSIKQAERSQMQEHLNK